MPMSNTLVCSWCWRGLLAPFHPSIHPSIHPPGGCFSEGRSLPSQSSCEGKLRRRRGAMVCWCVRGVGGACWPPSIHPSIHPPGGCFSEGIVSLRGGEQRVSWESWAPLAPLATIFCPPYTSCAPAPSLHSVTAPACLPRPLSTRVAGRLEEEEGPGALGEGRGSGRPRRKEGEGGSEMDLEPIYCAEQVRL